MSQYLEICMAAYTITQILRMVGRLLLLLQGTYIALITQLPYIAKRLTCKTDKLYEKYILLNYI